ncbi:hypothetical protein TNCT_733471 [Trichonephila clavata]|uniref:Uncharacterized protein n=1 Tax=Trichonephila clavata TaxID=2740835 RepID=A0A8X6J550_TRICU|nr:hypothetical protein TNCT_733471 [Trichonephila clavata]
MLQSSADPFSGYIEKFSTIGCNDQRHSVIRSITNEVLAIFYLNLTGKKVGEEKVEIGIHVLDPNAKSLLFKTFVQSSQGYFRNCGEKEFPCDDGKKIETLTLTLSKMICRILIMLTYIFENGFSFCIASASSQLKLFLKGLDYRFWDWFS